MNLITYIEQQFEVPIPVQLFIFGVLALMVIFIVFKAIIPLLRNQSQVHGLDAYVQSTTNKANAVDQEEDEPEIKVPFTLENKKLLSRFMCTPYAQYYSEDIENLVTYAMELVRAYLDVVKTPFQNNTPWTEEQKQLLLHFSCSQYATDNSGDAEELLSCALELVHAYLNALKTPFQNNAWTEEQKQLLLSFACSPEADYNGNDAEGQIECGLEMLVEYTKTINS